MLASFISYSLRYNVSTAAPVMMADLGLTEIQWGWVLAAFYTGYTLFQLPGGMLGDRFGPRVVLTVIAVLWSVFTAATALVPDLETASVGVISALWWWYARDNPKDHRAVNEKEVNLIRAGRTSGNNIDNEAAQFNWQQVLRNREVLWLTLSYLCPGLHLSSAGLLPFLQRQYSHCFPLERSCWCGPINRSNHEHAKLDGTLPNESAAKRRNNK